MAKFYRTEDRTVLLELFGAGSSVENLKNLKANTTDAAVEKHVPVVTQESIYFPPIKGCCKMGRAKSSSKEARTPGRASAVSMGVKP